MAVLNAPAREVVFKVVYYGPGLGGKTSSLQHVHAQTSPDHRGKMVSLATPVDRTLYFDYLPIRIPDVRGLGVRLQLFTVPGQIHFDATRKLVLTGVDALVFVADSQRSRLDANVESWEDLRGNLREHGRDLADVPHVFQYNKRDLPDVLPVNDLDRLLNTHGTTAFATIATAGVGIFEALESITRLTLREFERRAPSEARAAEIGLVLPEGGLEEALRHAEGSEGSRGRTPVPPPTSRMSGAHALGLPRAAPGDLAARALAEVGPATRLGARPQDDEAKGAVDPQTPQAPAPAPATSPASAVDERMEPSDPRLGAVRATSERGEPPVESPRSAPLGAAAVEPPTAEPVPPSEPSRHPAEPAAGVPPDLDAQAAGSSPPRGAEDTAASPALDPAEREPEGPPVEEAAVDPADVAVGPLSVPTAAQAPTERRGFGFGPLWAPDELPLVDGVEAAIAAGELGAAMQAIDQLVARGLARAAAQLGSGSDSLRDPAVVVLLLGVNVQEFVHYRATLREARVGHPVEARDVLLAYLFALAVRLARTRLSAPERCGRAV